MDAEESRVAEIEQRDADADYIVSENQVEQKQHREHFLQVSVRLPLLRELRFRALKHLQHAHRSVLVQLIEALLHLLRIHKHAMRQHQIEPLDQLMHVEALLSLLRSENIHIVQLQRIPLHLPLTILPSILQSVEDSRDRSLPHSGNTEHSRHGTNHNEPRPSPSSG